MSRPAELVTVDYVTACELAFAAGVSEKTIRRRMHLWELNPAHPLGIPYLRRLGKPYKIRRTIAERLLNEDARA